MSAVGVERIVQRMGAGSGGQYQLEYVCRRGVVILVGGAGRTHRRREGRMTEVGGCGADLFCLLTLQYTA